MGAWMGRNRGALLFLYHLTELIIAGLDYVCVKNSKDIKVNDVCAEDDRRGESS